MGTFFSGRSLRLPYWLGSSVQALLDSVSQSTDPVRDFDWYHDCGR